MSDSQYIESTTPGKHWNVYTYKPQGRPGYAMAVEGEYKPAGDGCMFDSFSYVMFEARQIRIDIIGRMTTKSRNAALVRLLDTMVEGKLVPPGTELKTVV